MANEPEYLQQFFVRISFISMLNLKMIQHEMKAN